MKAVQISAEDLELFRETLRLNHAEEQAYSEAQITALTAREQTLKQRLAKAYDDKLDGLITVEDWAQHTKEWRAEQDQIKRKLELYRQADRTYVDEGIKFFEFAHGAHAQYLAGNAEHRRELLQSLLSNCKITDATPSPAYRKPWVWLVEMNEMKRWGPTPDASATRAGLSGIRTWTKPPSSRLA